MARKFRIVRKDIYFGILLMLVAWYGSRVLYSLNGYYHLDVPRSANIGRIYIKRFDDGLAMHAFYENNGLTYMLLDKNGSVMFKGYVYDTYYADTLTYRHQRNSRNLTFVFEEMAPFLTRPNGF